MSWSRAWGFAGVMFAVLGAGMGHKDGAPEAGAQDRPPVMAADGVPKTVKIPAGAFLMGADAAALPASVTRGFGVMSERPDHGDFDELPAHPVRLSHSFSIGVTEVSPQEFQQFDPTYAAGSATPAYAAGVAGNRLSPTAHG